MTRRSLLASGMALAAQRLMAADGGLHLTLHLAKSRYRVGEPIPLEWTLENVSKRPLSLIAFHEAGGGSQFQELSLHLTSGGGAPREVPTVFPSSAIRPVWKRIAPAGQLKQELDLATSLALMVPKIGPGTYRLTARYAMSAASSPEGEASWTGSTEPVSVDFEIA